MNVLIIDDKPERLKPLVVRIVTALGHDCCIYPSISQGRVFLETPESDVVAVILNQRLSISGPSPFGPLPVIVVSDGLTVEAGQLLRAENVLDYVMDYSAHNHVHIIGLLRRAQFQGQVKVLVVDAESTVRNLFANLLKKHGFHVLQARHGKEALALLEEHTEVRLILTDLDMPVMSGAALIQAVRARFSKQELPIIGLADEHQDGVAVQFLRLGANDVISMPPRSLFEVQVRVMQNLTLAEAFQEILELSRKDFLTGLFNRRHFYETAEKLFAQMRRGRIKVAVAMLDIDNFKKVNDTYGHGCGDLAIIETARVLRQNLRDTDVLARFGGEEFCILLAGLDPDSEGMMVMERLIEKVAQNVIEYEGYQIQITVSCGLCIEPLQGLEPMIQMSDKLLYLAKMTGKNKVVAKDVVG